MLDKVKSATATRISTGRSGAVAPAAEAVHSREVAPAAYGSGVHDDRPRPRWSARDPDDREAGEAARQAIDEALGKLLPGGAEPLGAGGKASTHPHGRAADAYGQRADPDGRRAALRPGAVFSARF